MRGKCVVCGCMIVRRNTGKQGRKRSGRMGWVTCGSLPCQQERHKYNCRKYWVDNDRKAPVKYTEHNLLV